MSTVDEDVKKVQAQERAFEKILSYLPGYSGYKQKEIRRETDRLVRQACSSNIKKSIDAIRAPLASLQLEEGDRIFIDNLLARVDMIHQKVDRATAGYSGFFDVVKVDEGKLDGVLANDKQLLDATNSLVNLARPLMESQQDLGAYKARTKMIADQLQVVESSFETRIRLLSNME